MPVGLIIFSWDDRIGAEIKAKFPKNIEFDESSLKKIYSSHFLEERGGFLSLMVGNTNIASYFTGAEMNFFISLFLNYDEDPDNFEEILITSAQKILINLEDKKYLSLLPKIYSLISLYPTLNDKQKLALSYTDEFSRLIIGRLVKEGNLTKNTLLNWLKEKFDVDFLDIDGILNSLVNLGLIKVSLMRGLPSEMIFLINDVFLVRKPPSQIIARVKNDEMFGSIAKNYLFQVKEFFRTYLPTDVDEKTISDLISDNDCFNLLKLLRLAPITLDRLENEKKNFKDLATALKKFSETGLYLVLKAEGAKEYYLLKNDISIEKFFPEYLIDVIRTNFNNKTVATPILIEHLKTMKDIVESKSHLDEKIDEIIDKITSGVQELPVGTMRTKQEIFFKRFCSELDEK